MITTAKMATLIANIIATGRVLDPAATYLGAFIGISDQGPATTLADLTLPPGSLATALALTTWGTPYYLNNGNVVADAAPKTFSPASSAEGCTVIGFYLADAATAGNLVEYQYFASPFVLVDEHSSLTVIKRLVGDCAGVWDQSIAYNG